MDRSLLWNHVQHRFSWPLIMEYYLDFHQYVNEYRAKKKKTHLFIIENLKIFILVLFEKQTWDLLLTDVFFTRSYHIERNQRVRVRVTSENDCSIYIIRTICKYHINIYGSFNFISFSLSLTFPYHTTIHRRSPYTSYLMTK